MLFQYKFQDLCELDKEVVKGKDVITFEFISNLGLLFHHHNKQLFHLVFFLGSVFRKRTNEEIMCFEYFPEMYPYIAIFNWLIKGNIVNLFWVFFKYTDLEKRKIFFISVIIHYVHRDIFDVVFINLCNCTSEILWIKLPCKFKTNIVIFNLGWNNINNMF